MRPRIAQFRTPILAAGVCLLAAAGANAQYIVNPNRLSAQMRNFEWRPDDQPLSCWVGSLRPTLNFGFRFQSGFVVRVPMNQYRGKGHRWTVLVRVTPEAGQPVYFASR